MPSSDAQVAEIKQTLELLLEKGAVYELRALEVENGNWRSITVGGYFKNRQLMAEAAAKLSGRADGVYFTLNPTRPGLLARAANRVRPIVDGDGTKDKEVSGRRLLLVDVDPVRDRGISSTDQEHQAALERAEKVASWLSEQGWPPPIVADSGNGAHLLYRINLKNNDATTLLVKRVLEALAARFNDDMVTIDTACSNASRISKLYGTLAAKGDSIEERPHRMAAFVNVPPESSVISEELLEKVASRFTAAQDPPREHTSSAGGSWVERWLERYQVAVKSVEPYKGGRKFILNCCPFNSSHVGTSAAIFEGSDPKNNFGFRCQHQECEGKTGRDVRQMFEPEAEVSDEAEASVRYNWPDALQPEAFHGPAGDVVRIIEPHSEADPAALLVQFLAGFGSIAGRSAYFLTDGAQQFANFNVLIVGQTAKGRKGTSWSQSRRVLEMVDPQWRKERNVTGLSSGEGLIWAVRDAIREHSPIREKGRITGYQDIEADPGISDKRLLAFEAEFARVLRVSEREANTLTAVIREAFDTGDLNVLTKKQSARATGAHISIIGQITRDELRCLLTDTAIAGGFANRFAMVCSRRSKLLPEGGQLAEANFSRVIPALREAAKIASKIGQMRRDKEARAVWQEVYGELSEGKPGMLGAVTSRADTLTVRLSMVYALLDSSAFIRKEHLLAALAVWRYSADSARFIFGDAVGNETADEIFRQLRTRPDGMTRTEIRDLFKRNKKVMEINLALDVLQEHGMARVVIDPPDSAGRPTERWYALATFPGTN
jgi:hypothetical protein